MNGFEDVKIIQEKGAICFVFVVPLCICIFTLIGFFIDQNIGMLEFKSHHIPLYTLIGLHMGLFLAVFSSVKLMKSSF